MRDTPETDALMDVWRVEKLLSVGVMLNHARKLERERNKARDTVLSLRKQRAIARKFGEQMERECNKMRDTVLASMNTLEEMQ